MKRNDAVHVALVGSGSWASVIGDAIGRSEQLRLVTCYSRTPANREAFARRYGCDREESYEALLAREDIQGVLLITPNALHAEQTAQAARAGKHVFVDKPIANTLADGREMIAVCRENKRHLVVGHNGRRLAGLRKMKALIDGGAIGRPVMAEANFSNFLGFELTPDKWRWRGDDTGCPGGPLMTIGIHHADNLIYLLGPIASAFAFFSHLHIPAPVEDVTATVLKFDSGVLGYLGSNYCSPKANYLSVFGTEANLVCNVTLPNVPFDEYLKVWPVVDRYTQLFICRRDRDGGEEVPLAAGDPILEEVEEFARSIRTGERPETDGEGGLASLALIRAAITSAGTGKEAALEK